VKVLDLYSGSGSVGLEALSRGAFHATCVDFASECVQTSLKNAEKCGYATEVRAVQAKVEDFIHDPQRYNVNHAYDLVVMTPPCKKLLSFLFSFYFHLILLLQPKIQLDEEGIYNNLLNGICNSTLIKSDSLIALEYPLQMGTLPFQWNYDLFGLRNRRYGRTILAIYVYKPTKDYDFRQDEFTHNGVKRGSANKPKKQ
jgi:16S rRNA G966 N2-methylase RsmD